MQAIAFLVFMLLPLSVLLTFGVLGLVVLQEAFAPSPAGAEAGSLSGAGLPLLTGEALRSWAAGWARQIVANFATRPLDRRSAVTLARELETETTSLIDRSLPGLALSRDHCGECSRQPIKVTVPEALAIVDELRRNGSSRERRRVYTRAQDNLSRQSLASTVSEAPVCPLLADDERCTVFAARPLYCRSHCGVDCIMGDRRGEAEEGQTALATTMSDGISDGLAQSLQAAQLDARSYELNHALVNAFDVPHPEARWARGEQVFPERD